MAQEASDTLPQCEVAKGFPWGEASEGDNTMFILGFIRNAILWTWELFLNTVEFFFGWLA